MMIKDVIFPEPLLNALRDERLVVFAGAGVSMGPPAGLPSFRKLAERVAERVAKGTSQSIAESETDDQFLGRLKDRGVQVHQRAAEILQPKNLEPNALHRNLLRLFKKTGPVRIVTTNFDRLFEQAAEAGDLFQTQPKAFGAPALPPGSRFQGIVHLHGSVNEPEEMVLTHRDFGRAYLTEEDGWARRFLVSLFANHTVLFVGYSHSDTIMTYLTPSLPPDGKGRFALVGSTSGDLDRWRRMGIESIIFLQENKSDFTHLDAGVEGLANFGRRGVLNWQQEIARIAAGEPPMVDDEASDVINHALTSEDLTRFFVSAAKSPKWIAWLDQQGYLKNLFIEGKIKEKDRLLSTWLAIRFARAYSSELLSVIYRCHGKMNRHLWTRFVFQLHYIEDNPLDPRELSQWVHILMNCIPMSPDEDSPSIPISDYEEDLWNLAEHCIKADVIQGFLQVYDAITARLIWFLPGSEDRYDSWDYKMKKLWKESLQPNLQKIAHTLLERATMRLERRHAIVMAWDGGTNKSIDRDSSFRAAIEPHEQDRYPPKIHSLIDVTRDCLEWLAINEPITAGNWCDRFISSDLPLLRRLAIHTTNARQDLSADDKITWLLEHCNINEYSAHHEIFRMASHVYPQTSYQKRIALIQAISDNDDDDSLAAYNQFNWFRWLHQADPKCVLINTKLENILTQYPDFTPREHPDLHFWSTEFRKVESPWSIEELLAKPALKWLPDLLAYRPNEPRRSFEHSRVEMLRTVQQAAENNTVWGLDLADAMAAASKWDSDLWYWVISAWKKAKLDRESKRQVLSYLSISELYQENSGDIADVLRRFLEEDNSEDAAELLDKIHEIATALYPYTAAVQVQGISYNIHIQGISPDTSWFTKAINHPSGKLTHFWIDSIDRWRKQQAVPPKVLNPEHCHALNIIIEDNGVSGKLGRVILVSQLCFLHYVDETWVEQNLLPLLDANHEDFLSAWDGLTFLRSLSPQLLELLRDKLIDALQRGIREFPKDTLGRFVKLYVIALTCLIQDVQGRWIGEFFNHADNNNEVKYKFAVQICNRLRNLDESQQQEWWNVWLKDYWKNRLQGVPCRLENGEIAEMLKWVIHLQGVFSEAVDTAVKMEPVILESHSMLLYQIDESNLIDRYPSDLAKLLIYLGQQKSLPWFWVSNLNVLENLLQKNLPEDLAQGLQELVARLQ